MRTTLDIDADVLQAVKELAQLQGSTAGHILSKLARDSLTKAGVPPEMPGTIRNGVRVFGARPRELLTSDAIWSLVAREP